MIATRPAFWLSLVSLTIATRADSLWTRRYDGPSSCARNAAFCILPDPAHRIVYFCGQGEHDYPLHTDILVGAYGFDGRLVDVKSIGGWTGTADIGHALALDTDGRLFVCGMTEHPGSRSWDFTWARYGYDPTGDSLVNIWANKSLSPGPDAAFDIIRGRGDDLYLCGAAAPDTLNPDRSYLLVARIDVADGLLRWIRFLSPDSSAGVQPRPLPDPELPFDLLNWDCYGAAIALDAAGNIIVAGAGGVSGSGHEAWLVKLDTLGNVLAQTRWHGTSGDFIDALFAMTIAPDGTIYACGCSETEEGCLRALMLRADTALQVTAARVFGPVGDELEAWASRVCIDDATGDVFVTGGLDDWDNGWQMFTQRFSPTLAQRWPGPGSLLGGTADDRGVDVTTHNGLAFVAGELDSSLAVVCYGASPVPLWVWRCDSPDNSGAIGAAVGCCGADALFVGGSARRDFGNWSSLVLARLDTGSGVTETRSPHGRTTPPTSVVRGVFHLTPDVSNMKSEVVFLDAAGRRVLVHKPGASDISRLAPGVYFVQVRPATGAHRLVVTR